MNIRDKRFELCSSCVKKLKKEYGKLNYYEKKKIPLVKVGQVCERCYADSLGVEFTESNTSINQVFWDLGPAVSIGHKL